MTTERLQVAATVAILLVMQASDSIALVSVGSSALIAFATVVVSALGARDQRRHETDLSFEGRVWERKVDAHLDLIRHVLALQKAARDPDTWSLAMDMATANKEILEKIQPTLAAYASRRCLEDLDKLLDLWRSSLDSETTLRVEQVLRARQVVRDVGAQVPIDPAMTKHLDHFVEVADELAEHFKPNIRVLRSTLDDLLRSTRASLKASED